MLGTNIRKFSISLHWKFIYQKKDNKWFGTLDGVLVKHVSVHLIIIISNKYTFIHWPVFPKNTFNGWWEVWNLIGSIINLQDRIYKFVSHVCHYNLPYQESVCSLSRHGLPTHLQSNTTLTPDFHSKRASPPITVLYQAWEKNPENLTKQTNKTIVPRKIQGLIIGLAYGKKCKFRHNDSKLLKSWRRSRCTEQLFWCIVCFWVKTWVDEASLGYKVQ